MEEGGLELEVLMKIGNTEGVLKGSLVLIEHHRDIFGNISKKEKNQSKREMVNKAGKLKNSSQIGSRL